MSTRAVFCSFLILAASTRVDAQCNNDYILVSTMHIFNSIDGAVSVLDPATKTATIGVETVSSLATLRLYGDRVYGVNDDNRLDILDECNNFNSLIEPYTFADPSTPRDIVQISSFLYITRYERLGALRLTSNLAFAGDINMGALADADGVPEMDQMFAYGGRLYFCLQRVVHATGVPTGTSLLAVYDLATEALVDMDPLTVGLQGIPLILQKPATEINFRVQGGAHKAYFSCIGASGVLDGGVVQCDAANPSIQSVILTEANAGGDIGDVEIVSDTKGFAIILPSESTMELIAFNPTTGLKIGGAMLSASVNNFRYLTDIEPSSLGLLVADFNLVSAAGIRCFDMTTHSEIPGGPISMGEPPYDILVKTGATTGLEHAPLATALGQNYPNPFNPETTIPFSLADASRVTLRIYDVTGALVAALLDEPRDAGKHVARWDGRADSGLGAPTGIYFARLEATGMVKTRKLVLLK